MRTTIEKVSMIKDKTLDPRQFSYRLKHSLRKRINELLTSQTDKKEKDDKKEARDKIQSILDREEDSKEPLSYDDVTQLHRYWQRLDASGDLFYFCEFLDECRATLPEARSNKELDERLKRLQLESSNKSYQEMTRNITRGSNTGVNGIDIQAEVRSIRPILIALLNSVLVIGGTFVFVFKAVEYSMTTPDIVTQVMAALIAALIVALAEVYFLAKII